MNENDFFGYSQVKWLSIQVRWANVQTVDVKFAQDLAHKKSLKSVIFTELFEK